MSDDFEVGHHAHVVVFGVVAVEEVTAAVAVEVGDDLRGFARARGGGVLEAGVVGRGSLPPRVRTRKPARCGWMGW